MVYAFSGNFIYIKMMYKHMNDQDWEMKIVEKMKAIYPGLRGQQLFEKFAEDLWKIQAITFGRENLESMTANKVSLSYRIGEDILNVSIQVPAGAMEEEIQKEIDKVMPPAIKAYEKYLEQIPRGNGAKANGNTKNGETEMKREAVKEPQLEKATAPQAISQPSPTPAQRPQEKPQATQQTHTAQAPVQEHEGAHGQWQQQRGGTVWPTSRVPQDMHDPEAIIELLKKDGVQIRGDWSKNEKYFKGLVARKVITQEQMDEVRDYVIMNGA